MDGVHSCVIASKKNILFGNKKPFLSSPSRLNDIERKGGGAVQELVRRPDGAGWILEPKPAIPTMQSSHHPQGTSRRPVPFYTRRTAVG